MFGPPARSEKDGKLIFTVPILDRPATTPTEGGLHYTLTSAAGAVSRPAALSRDPARWTIAGRPR